MEITGVNTSQFGSIVRYVSDERYEGNLIATKLDRMPLKRQVRISARLGVQHGRGELWDGLADLGRCAPGARRSSSGRRGPYACWDAVRDVLNVMFEQYPDALVTAGIHWRVTYDGLDGFRKKYPGTGRVNIGSRVTPTTMPQLCDCSSEIRRTPLSAPVNYVIAMPF